MGLTGRVIYGPAVDRLTERDAADLQREMKECFWNRRWLAAVPAGQEEAHAFVQRPACRIARGRPLYVTSADNVVDSLTTLTEEAVGPYPGPRPYALPNTVFERLASKPFETGVIQLLRQHGFVAGEVTSKGTWITQDGTIERPAGIPRPKGQIDVLAWHPSGYTILADCKVLQPPYTESAWINLWKKLHEDEQGFRSKIQENAAWSKEFLRLSRRAVSTFDTALILDQPLHLWHQSGDVIITDYPDLAEKLEHGRIPGALCKSSSDRDESGCIRVRCQ